MGECGLSLSSVPVCWCCGTQRLIACCIPGLQDEYEDYDSSEEDEPIEVAKPKPNPSTTAVEALEKATARLNLDGVAGPDSSEVKASEEGNKQGKEEKSKNTAEIVKPKGESLERWKDEAAQRKDQADEEGVTE